MDATFADQSDQVQRPPGALRGPTGLDERLVVEERPVLDRLRDSHQVLHHDAAGAQVEVPDLAVAHLPFGQSHGKPGGLEQRAGGSRDERVPRRHRRHRDRIPLALAPIAPTIQNDQYDGTLWQEISL
jgi:hypothetical protein